MKGAKSVKITEAYLLLLVMLVVVAVSSIFFKNRMTAVTPMIFVATGVTTLVAGMGLRIREIVEGPFVYLDTVMWVICGSIFVAQLYFNGTFDYLFQRIISKQQSPKMKLLLLVLFIALPGMLTGTAAASIVTTGLLAGRWMLAKGVEKAKVVELVAVGSFFGMMLPPLCLPAMTATIARQNGYPGSFEGYFVPMLVLTLPALLVYVTVSGKRLVGDLSADNEASAHVSFSCLVPVLVVAVLLFGHNFLYFVLPFIGYPVIYTFGFILAIFLGAKKCNVLESAAQGARMVSPELVLSLAFGAVTEIYTLVGTAGTIGAHFAILGINVNIIGVIVAVVTVLSAVYIGESFGYTFAALGVYIVSAVLYGMPEIVIVGIGTAMACALFVPLRGGIIKMTADTLQVQDIVTFEIQKKAGVAILVLLLTAIIYIMAGTNLRFLML